MIVLLRSFLVLCGFLLTSEVALAEAPPALPVQDVSNRYCTMSGTTDGTYYVFIYIFSLQDGHRVDSGRIAENLSKAEALQLIESRACN